MTPLERDLAQHDGEPDELYLIWSHERGAWWGPGGRGYTRRISAAGRYSREDALRECVGSIPGTFDRLNALPEIPVRLADVKAALERHARFRGPATGPRV